MSAYRIGKYLICLAVRALSLDTCEAFLCPKSVTQVNGDPMKKPVPSRDGWYVAIMQRSLRASNSPPLSVLSPRDGLGHAGHGVGELAGLKVGGCELIPPVIADAVSR